MTRLLGALSLMILARAALRATDGPVLFTQWKLKPFGSSDRVQGRYSASAGPDDPVLDQHTRQDLPGGRQTDWMAWTRDYLNDLVDQSATKKEDQLGNIAFVKTHKTASTTLAAVLYRYAVRHNLKLARFGNSTSVRLKAIAEEAKRSDERVDVFHYHINPRGKHKGTWKGAYQNFRAIMTEPDTINFVTVLREPRSHLLSYYYYYIQPKNQLSIEEFLLESGDLGGNEDHKLLRNPLSAEFGAKSEREVQQLIDNMLPAFKLVILTERLEEGLMVLRRIMRWDLIDVTYMTLNETKKGGKRWDGKPFVDRPDFDDLPEEVKGKIDELTALDRMLYSAGREEFEKRLAAVSDGIEADLAAFKDLQTTVRDYLGTNSSSGANPMYRCMDVYNNPPPLIPF